MRIIKDIFEAILATAMAGLIVSMIIAIIPMDDDKGGDDNADVQ